MKRERRGGGKMEEKWRVEDEKEKKWRLRGRKTVSRKDGGEWRNEGKEEMRKKWNMWEEEGGRGEESG